MLYQRYLGMSPLLDRFCREQIGRLQQNKNPLYGGKEAGAILELCKFILQNQQDILERELSMAVLKDSKRWEKKYRSKVCGLLRKYGDYESLFLGLTDDRDKEDKRETERSFWQSIRYIPIRPMCISREMRNFTFPTDCVSGQTRPCPWPFLRLL